MTETKQPAEGSVKITVEITPTEKGSRVKPYHKILEFQVNHEDLPLRVFAESGRVVAKSVSLAEEMCED